MIYFSGISTRHLSDHLIPGDDVPRFCSVVDCYHGLQGMHLKMMRMDNEFQDPYYGRYLACVEQFGCRLKLNYREFRNVVAKLVELYREYFSDNGNRRRQCLLDSIGKFERLIFMFANKTFPTHKPHGVA